MGNSNPLNFTPQGTATKISALFQNINNNNNNKKPQETHTQQNPLTLHQQNVTVLDCEVSTLQEPYAKCTPGD